MRRLSGTQHLLLEHQNKTISDNSPPRSTNNTQHSFSPGGEEFWWAPNGVVTAHDLGNLQVSLIAAINESCSCAGIPDRTLSFPFNTSCLVQPVSI